MQPIYNAVAIIRPKRSFVKWANSANAISGDGMEYSSEYYQHDSSVVLLPLYFSQKILRSSINSMWQDIFEAELRSRNTDVKLWPKDRTQKMFWQWFDVEYHTKVFDPSDK